MTILCKLTSVDSIIKKYGTDWSNLEIKNIKLDSTARKDLSVKVIRSLLP